ncbi:phage holin family protein [Candidatus Clostridium radicumherbarum]|uniref:Phage holin family protein n=1 Tax=Candidatus Clostridium radicumherbarum TaxID=3381662 RepID=A0ABW8TSQ7_9CLOT
MGDNGNENREASNGRSFFGWIGRFVLVALVLVVTSYLTPGFSISGIWSFLIAAVVITVLDVLVESFMKVDASPFGKGFKGFVISVIIIYIAQFFVPNMTTSIIGAILAAIVIGIIDAIIPGRAM